METQQPSGSGVLARYTADAAMYTAQQIPEAARGGKVTLLNATPDPLGSVAALCKAYVGEVVRDLAEVTDEERRNYFHDMTRTVLNGPLESVQFHFLLEGFSRALVDQLTRGRAGFYAVESLRFAVKEDYSDDVPLPPSLAGLEDDNPLLRLWRKGLQSTETMYHTLVEHGVPAEDARRLLPIGIATRAHWVVDLRELLSVSGKRLCTQAEFEWRSVFSQINGLLLDYHSGSPVGGDSGGYCDAAHDEDAWQFSLIANQLQPVCYQTGHCGFMAQFDRGCKIRGRVEANAAVGRPSAEWAAPLKETEDHEGIDPIFTSEWLLDPEAAR